MSNCLTYIEEHNFFNLRDYTFYALFLILIQSPGANLFPTYMINLIASVAYFVLIKLLTKKSVQVTKNMIKKGGFRFPMKGVQKLWHTGTHLYFVTGKHQYLKIYDPKRKLAKMIHHNHESLNLSKDFVSPLC